MIFITIVIITVIHFYHVLETDLQNSDFYKFNLNILTHARNSTKLD